MHEGCKKLPRVKKFTMVVAVFPSHTLFGAHSCFSFLLIPFRPLLKILTPHFFLQNSLILLAKLHVLRQCTYLTVGRFYSFQRSASPSYPSPSIVFNTITQYFAITACQ